MNGFSNNTKKTSVKIFVNVFTLLNFIFLPSLLQAETISIGGGGDCDYSDPAAKDKCLTENRANKNNDRTAATCSQLQKDLNAAKAEAGKICGSAGFGKDCGETMAACTEASSSESFNTLGALATAAGATSTIGGVLNQMNQQQQQQSGSTGCPKYGFQSYYQKKDKYTDDLDKAEEDLAKLTDDKANAEEDFNKEINDLQEDLNKAQEDLDKTKLEIADKKRKQMQDFQSSQASAKEELRKKGTDILQLRGKLITSQRDKALKLIAMTDASGTRACKKAVNDAKKDLTSTTSLNSSNMINKAKSNKQALIDTYNDCMSAFQQQRVALLESKKQEQDELNKAIDNANEDMTSIQDSLNTAQSQLTEMQNDAATEQSNAEQKLVKMMQNTQNKMAAAKQKLQTKMQTIAQKTQSYTEKINRLNNSLATLGPVPDEGVTKTAKTASADYDAQEEAIAAAQEGLKLNGCKAAASRSRANGGLGG